MRRWTTRGGVATGTVLATMLLVGSVSQASASTPAASAAGAGSQVTTADGPYRQCLRDHGVRPQWDRDHPRPGPQFGAPGEGREKFREAREKCAAHRPNQWPGGGDRSGPHSRERAQKMRGCLQDHGVTPGDSREKVREAIKDCRAEVK